MDDARSREGISWERLFPLRALLRAMRLAAGARALFLALVGVQSTELGWRALAWLFGRSSSLEFDRFDLTAEPIGLNDAAGSLLFPTVQFVNQAGAIESKRLVPDFSFTSWEYLSRPFLNAFAPDVDWISFFHLLLCGVWTIFVWSFFGTMIARQAAVSLARDERLSGRRIGSFALEKWTSVFAAPLTPMLGIFLLAIPLVVFGLLLRLNFGVLLAGIFWPLALVFAFAMAVLGIGLLFGWPLMWAAIAAEGSDSFDAVSRAYAYVFHRPLLVIWYACQALLVGAIGSVLAQLFFGVLLAMCAWGVSWGVGGSPDQAFLESAVAGSGIGWLGSKLIFFWTGVVMSAPAIFLFAYLWTAFTAIYFALRHEVDGTEFDDVYLPEEKEAPHALPTLGADEAGVPKVAD